jgi:ERF superfamily
MKMDKNNLASALVYAQSRMGTARKSGFNPHFKNNFSTLEDLIDSTRDVLTASGLAVTQYPDSDGTHQFLVTKLKHISGEEEVSRALIVLKDPSDIQKLGSAISYIKRYAYAAICGIATSDGDDDGSTHGSSYQPAQNNQPFVQPAQNGTEVKPDTISIKQLGLLKGKLKESGNPLKEQEICRKYNIGSLAQLPWRKMNEVLENISSLQNPQPAQTDAFADTFEDAPL